jgi:hypothetical protein
MEHIPFRQRLGPGAEKLVEHDFPIDARIGLAYLLADLHSKSYLKNQESVFGELFRRARFAALPSLDYTNLFFANILEPLKGMEWWAIYDFCERVYEGLLAPVGYRDAYDVWVEEVGLSDIRNYFSTELNLLLAEENIAYQFVDGRFQRRGRAQTQKNIQRMGSVLATPALADVRRHYNKARQFFDQKPEPDSANCIKEALCSLEACLGVFYKEDFSADFTKLVKRHQGNGPSEIPSPIAEGIIKLHAYRGSGQGVAHAALEGSRVSEVEAELILNLVASYVTYLVDMFAKVGEDVPF